MRGSRYIILIGLVSFCFSALGSIPFPSLYKLNNPTKVNPRVYDNLYPYNIIFLGEWHGTNEAPAFTYGLLKLLNNKSNSVILGLEIPKSEQPFVDQFIYTKNYKDLAQSRFFNGPYKDGRSSRAMAKLILNASELKNVKVICFDSNSATSNQERDTNMAINFINALKKYDSKNGVILSGSIHSSTIKGNFFDSRYRPMAYEIKQLNSNMQILSIKIDFLSGMAWNCSDKNHCGPRYIQTPIVDYKNTDFENHLEFFGHSSSGYGASAFFNKISASAPVF